MLAFALEADGCAGGSLDAEAHDGLIDRPDYFHFESAVADAFAFEDAKLFENAMNHAVADKRKRADRLSARGSTFEKRIAVGVEEVAGARGHF